MKFINYKIYIFLTFVAFIGIYRFALIDRGAVSFPDEEIYYHSVSALSYLFDGDIKKCCNSISTTYGRPGEATLRLIPVFGQRMLDKYFAIKYDDPRSLLIETIFNIIISIAILIIFYKISLILFEQKIIPAIISTVVYSLLVNNNLYIRHILPYNNSLLFFMIIIYYLLKNLKKKSHLSTQNIIIIGSLAGFSFATWDGSYVVPPFVFLMLLFTNQKTFDGNNTITQLLVLILSTLSVLFFYEIIARIGGLSFLKSLFIQSTSQNQGSFEEGFTFLPKYLIQVEGLIGYAIMICTISYLIMVFYDGIKNKSLTLVENPLKILILIVFIQILFHGFMTVIFHKLMFYGRFLHLFYPFLVWATIAFIFETINKKHQIWFFIVLVLFSLISFVKFSSEYLSLAYPGDVLYQNKIRIYNTDSSNLINESPVLFKISNPGHVYKKSNFSYPAIYTENDFVLVNFCFYYPISNEYTAYQPAKYQKLLYDAQHWQSFIAYQFEGSSIEEREMISRRNYRVRIYKN
ncbi:MAG: hypothetical protein NTZ24_12775 [Deltaproteobacteria bacterium]|nr:hypothetical protein [Deltaproteobacteria bacterium]